MDPAAPALVGFKPHLRVQTVPAQAVCLISERGITALSGPSIEKLAPLLDGTRTVARVKQEAEPALSAAEVENLLATLHEAGLLAVGHGPAASALDAQARAYWSLAGLDAGAARAGRVGGRDHLHRPDRSGRDRRGLPGVRAHGHRGPRGLWSFWGS